PPAPVMVSVLMVAVTPLSMVSTLRRLRLPGLGGVLPFRLRDQLPPLGTLRGWGGLDERLWRDRTSCPVSVNLVHADRKPGGVSLNLVCDLGMARLFGSPMLALGLHTDAWGPVASLLSGPQAGRSGRQAPGWPLRAVAASALCGLRARTGSRDARSYLTKDA